eukprot:TRINITY_DN85_c0_g1_i1.p1 TRINITY_DN85_c0_g1~~TRINITY_DN85_c0_g1_i1.p1  ORF type:complete len:782 (+),score=191.83 TRINITY_DN85_c0_g1_i1:135-2480(+)
MNMEGDLARFETTKEYFSTLEKAKKFLQSKGIDAPEVGMILGSGLKDFASALKNPITVPMSEVPGLLTPSVSGHATVLYYGDIGPRKVLCFGGRVHLYEGIHFREACFAVRLSAALGCKVFLVTNAAGGSSPAMEAGSFMLMNDHMRFTRADPLSDLMLDENIVRNTSAPYYSERLLEHMRRVSVELDVPVVEGAYCWASGPSYETGQEVAIATEYGSSAFGMSTVPEVLTANSCGMEVLGISFITNLAAGISKNPLTHDEVKETANLRGPPFQKLVTGIISSMEMLPDARPLPPHTGLAIELGERRFFELPLEFIRSNGSKFEACQHAIVCDRELFGAFQTFPGASKEHALKGLLFIGENVLVLCFDGAALEPLTTFIHALKEIAPHISVARYIPSSWNEVKSHEISKGMIEIGDIINFTQINPLKYVQCNGKVAPILSRKTLGTKHMWFPGTLTPSHAEMKMATEKLEVDSVSIHNIVDVYLARAFGFDVRVFSYVPGTQPTDFAETVIGGLDAKPCEDSMEEHCAAPCTWKPPIDCTYEELMEICWENHTPTCLVLDYGNAFLEMEGDVFPVEKHPVLAKTLPKEVRIVHSGGALYVSGLASFRFDVKSVIRWAAKKLGCSKILFCVPNVFVASRDDEKQGVSTPFAVFSGHINLTGLSPLTGHNDDRFGDRFFDMSNVYPWEKLLSKVEKMGATPAIVATSFTSHTLFSPAECTMFHNARGIVPLSVISDITIARHLRLEIFGIGTVVDAGKEDRSPVSVSEVESCYQAALSAVLHG